MSSITFDLGNAPSVLEALRNPRNAQRVASAMAESYVTDIHDWIEAGHSFTSRYGHLQQAINWRPTGNGTAQVYVRDQTFDNYDEELDYRFEANPAGYAWDVEKGTRAHVIGPKAGRKGLKVPVSGGGGYIIRRSVNHPGSQAQPYFFADSANRSQHMQAAGVSVLARIIANGQ